MEVQTKTSEDHTSYFEIDALSQTDAKKILSIRYPEDSKREDKEHFLDGVTVGDAVDIKLTRPDEFDNKYYVFKGKVPSDNIILVIRAVYDKIKDEESLRESAETDLMNLDEFHLVETAIEEACKVYGYLQSYKPATRMERVWKEGKALLQALMIAGDRGILSTDYMELVDNVVESITEHEHTRDYFLAKNDPALDVEFQKVIIFEQYGVTCKAMLDLVIINRSNADIWLGNLEIPAKTVIPIDIKTTAEKTKDFVKAAKRFRYDIQAAWYYKACKQEYPDLNIADFKFIVESTTDIGYPKVFTTSELERWIGEHGAQVNGNVLQYMDMDGSHSFVNRTYPIYGFKDAIEEAKYFKEKGVWRYMEELESLRGHYNLELYDVQ